MEKSRVERINELAHKAKTEGLTEEEIIERDRLRQEYLAAFRQNLRAQLDNTYLVDDHGNKRPLKPKHTADGFSLSLCVSACGADLCGSDGEPSACAQCATAGDERAVLRGVGASGAAGGGDRDSCGVLFRKSA